MSELEPCPICNTTEPPIYDHLAGDLKLVCECGFSTPWMAITWKDKNDGFEECEKWWNTYNLSHTKIKDMIYKNHQLQNEVEKLLSELAALRKVAEAATELVMGRTIFKDNLGKALAALEGE